MSAKHLRELLTKDHFYAHINDATNVCRLIGGQVYTGQWLGTKSHECSFGQSLPCVKDPLVKSFYIFVIAISKVSNLDHHWTKLFCKICTLLNLDWTLNKMRLTKYISILKRLIANAYAEYVKSQLFLIKLQQSVWVQCKLAPKTGKFIASV